MKLNNYTLTVGFTVIFMVFLAIILSASIMGVFDGFEPYKQLIAAMLSVAATGVITALLLFFQRKQQEQLNREQREFQQLQTLDQRKFDAEQKEKEKDRLLETKVFEEKLNIYKEFLKKLCDVVKDMEITPQEEIELQFQVSYIAMHTKSDSIKIISEQVRDIVVDIKNNVGGKKNMLSQLFVIADTLYKELYKEEYTNNKEDRTQTTVNFESILFPKDSMRLYELKKSINAEGSNQWVDDNDKLIYEYFCANSTNKFIKENGTISVGVFYQNKQCCFSVMTKGNNPEAFLKKVQETCDELKVFKMDSKDSFVADVGTDDGKIIEFFNVLLSRIKDYRETDFPK